MDSEHSDSERPAEKIKSVRDFSRHSIDGLAQVQDPNLALELLGHFVDDGMAEAEVVQRIVWSPYADQLFEKLAEYYQEEQCGKQPLALADALMSLDEKDWACGNLTMRKVVTWLVRWMSARELFRVFGELLLDEDHPLFEQVNADEYWIATVQHFTINRDYRRAWEEIRKARGGLLKINRIPPTDGDIERLRRFHRDPDNRCYRASKKCMMSLVNQLFDAMHEAGKIPDRRATDCLVCGGRDAPQAPLPSLEFAVSLGCEKYEDRDVWRLSPTGVMVLLLARHFCDQKNARKRRSREGELAKAPKLCDLAKR
jgi:hypothetical protein